MLSFTILLCALVPSLVPQETPAGPGAPEELAPTGAAEGSLENLLERAKAKQAALLAALAPRVEPLVARLGTKTGFSSEVALARAELLAMGPAIAPLLVPALEVNPEEDVDSLQRALEVQELLIELQPGGVNRQLIELASSASTRGRQNAIRVLGHVSNSVGVTPFLIQVYREGEAALQPACIQALAQRGGLASLRVLREALQDTDAEVRRNVLRALAVARDAQSHGAVLDAISVPAAASNMLREVIQYYRAVPEAVDADVVRALGRLAIENSSKADECTALLRFLPELSAVRKVRELRSILEPLKESGTPAIRDAGLVCLYLLGDRQAKKELLESYDENIKQDPRFPSVYIERGEVLLSVQEFNDAAKDFKQALDLMNSQRSPVFRATMINLARAQTLGGKLSRAEDTLAQLNLSSEEKRVLRADPSFRELLANPRYGKVLS